MADRKARPWTRVQDWISLVAGLYLALSPLWFDVATAATWAMVGTGAVIAVMALVALAMPGAYVDEAAMVVGGLAAVLSPWLFSFTEETGAAWSAWAVGGVVVISALAALPASRHVSQVQHHAA